MKRATIRITVVASEYGVEHVGVGKWDGIWPVALGTFDVDPFDDRWLAVWLLADSLLDEQLTLF